MLLDRLLGTWHLEMRHVAVPAPVHGRQVFERVLDGAFVLQRWTYEHPAFPDALALWTPTRWDTYDVRGVVRTFEVTLGAADWSTIRRDPDFWQRSSMRFVDDDTVNGEGENSDDEGWTWEHDYDVTYRRVREPGS